MKINKKSNKKLILAVALFALTAVIIVVFFVMLKANQQSSSTKQNELGESEINYSPPSEEDKKETDQRKEEITKEGAVTPQEDIVVTLSRASQIGAGEPLNIRTVVTGATEGTCNITLSKDGQQPVKRELSLSFAGTYYTCENADIPASEFGATGAWNLKINVTNNNKTSNEIVQEVAIK